MTKAQILAEVNKTGPTFETKGLRDKVSEVLFWSSVNMGESKESGSNRILNLIDELVTYVEKH